MKINLNMNIKWHKAYFILYCGRDYSFILSSAWLLEELRICHLVLILICHLLLIEKIVTPSQQWLAMPKSNVMDAC